MTINDHNYISNIRLSGKLLLTRYLKLINKILAIVSRLNQGTFALFFRYYDQLKGIDK